MTGRPGRGLVEGCRPQGPRGQAGTAARARRWGFRLALRLVLGLSVLMAGCRVGGCRDHARSEPSRPSAPPPLLAALEWVALPAGHFDMGSANVLDEEPVHTVTVPAFELLRSEVTLGQYRACVELGHCETPHTRQELYYCNWGHTEREDHPINCVSWHQARRYCDWVQGRLPSEAEWEYAARAGGRAIPFPWGSEEPSCERAVLGGEREKSAYRPRLGNVLKGFLRRGCGKDRTWPVCSMEEGHARLASGATLCDLAGNVYEWVEDCWAAGYESAPRDGSPSVSSCLAKDIRVMRGGSWAEAAFWLRTANRIPCRPERWYAALGFRCARTSDGRQPGER